MEPINTRTATHSLDYPVSYPSLTISNETKTTCPKIESLRFNLSTLLDRKGTKFMVRLFSELPKVFPNS